MARSSQWSTHFAQSPDGGGAQPLTTVLGAILALDEYFPKIFRLFSMTGGPAADWRSSQAYRELLVSDRRTFAWEWLRRNDMYRRLWSQRGQPGAIGPERFALLGWIDPALPAPDARPIWSIDKDPRVLRARLATASAPPDDLFDIRSVAPFVSVEIGVDHIEHWLLSDGHWAIRLDLQGGTLLGSPALVEQRIAGLQSARPKLEALRQFIVLASAGHLPASMIPRERKAAQWIRELRAGDAILDGASQHQLAHELFGAAMSARRWRVENSSHRLRVQRLFKIARMRLSCPLDGPWFD